MKKIFYFLLSLILFFLSFFLFFPYFQRFLSQAGLIEVQVNIAGTGSMYPTFPKLDEKDEIAKAKEIVAWPKMRPYPSGFNFLGLNLFSYRLKRGDIIEFENEKTRKITKEKYGEEAGFVKRIIALPKDTLEMRDGFVFLNGKILDEPYIAKPRSTYGGEFLPDCQVLTIPKNKVFVLGDNRKASLDSRHSLGLVDFQDIHFVLPWEKQKNYQTLWRDTSRDLESAHTPTLEKEEFAFLLNEARKRKKLKPLNLLKQLSLSAKKRGEARLKANDFSREGKELQPSLITAIKESGYQNILFAEIFTRGFYEAQELLDNFLEFPETRTILFSPQYQDIGVSAVLGEIENCPVQVILVHLGGYQPPNYSKEQIESWQNLINNLNNAISSWEVFQGQEGIDQEKLKKFLEILRTRKSYAEKVLSRMKANQWLTFEEEKFLEEEKKLGEEADKLFQELEEKNH